LGQAISRSFRDAGAKVIGFGHGWLPNLNLALEMRVDVTDAHSVERAFKKIEAEFQRVDVLVNNVGFTLNRMAGRLHDDEWHRLLDVNLMGAVRCSREASRLMILQKSGCVINISSLAARYPNIGQVAYSASKAGIEAMTRTMALEWASKHIRVNAIAPGFIEGKMVAELSDEMRQKIIARSPVGRFGKPQEIAQVALFLASNEASYITGQVLDVSGGLGM
jgi:3-oxoacyl-[acyl-carrier protein] reductase